jgi:acyl-CoA synthetase (AMP-forming)/AMP-acid ligase II
MNVGLLLEMTAGSAPERVAASTASAELDYATLLARAQRLARLLVDRGVERLGYVDLNSELLPICLFGAGMAGVPFAPVNYRLTAAQLEAIVQRLAPATVVVGPDHEPLVAAIDGIDVIRAGDLTALLDEPDERLDAIDLPFVDPDDVAVLLFTSGTTGEPKAAVLRHRHLAGYILGSVEFLGAGEDEAQLVSVPPYHIAGISSVLSCAYSGRRIHYLPAFDSRGWIAAVREVGVTQAMVVPTMLGRVLADLEAEGATLPSLRHLSYGGGRMPVELIERAMAAFPEVAFVNAYGLTETSSTIAVLGPEEHREAITSDDPAVRARLGSVGRPLPSVEVEIRGPEGEVLPPGERGEVYVRGEQVAGEYLGRSVLVDGGWFPTNDAGYLDDAGYLYLDGRLDDVIVRGAENLSPGEIELTLAAHPAVAEAAVVGIPDPEWGEAVAAAVVIEPGSEATAEELQAWVRERLRSTKTPTVIQFRDELPYNETGKLLRRILREELVEHA